MPSRGHLELYAHDKLEAGREFFISYGSEKANVELMRDYGFCIPNNPEDVVYIVSDLKGFHPTDAGALLPHGQCGLLLFAAVPVVPSSACSGISKCSKRWCYSRSVLQALSR